MKKDQTGSGLLSRLFFRLLGVQILLAGIGAVNGLVTSLFVAGAGLDGEVMSAIGLYTPINTIIGAINMVFMTGATILSGKYMGRNELRETQNVFSWDLWIITILGAAFTAVLLPGGLFGFISGIFTSDEALRRHLDPYVTGQAAGVLPLMLNLHISSFLSLENQSRRTTIASLVCIAANVLLNFLFLNAGLIRNALGLALGASLGQWIFLVVQLMYYFSGKSVLKLRVRPHRGRTVLDMAKIGYPGALSSAYQALRGIIVNALILGTAAVGSAGLSAFTASTSVLNLFWAVFSGILAVSRMLISISIGEEDRRSLVDCMKVAMFRGVPLMTAVAAVAIVLAVPMTRLFYSEADGPVFQMTVNAFRILPLCMPLSVICMHFVCYGQTSGKTLLVHILSILDGVVCVAAFSALLMPWLGMDGVYTANVLNGIVCVLVIVLYAWLVRKRFPRSIEDLMVIPDDFGVAEIDRLDICVRSMDQVMTVSERVVAFCREHGIDERRTYHSGLFLEEMAGNVVDHGFRKDKKQHAVDIRVAYKGDDVILRIKDDCVPFDPAERQDLIDPKDKIKNMGIRMVYKGAKDVSYQNMLGLNVLTIRI